MYKIPLRLMPGRKHGITFPNTQTKLTLSGTGPHCKTCGAPQRIPLWPGLQSSWSLQAEVPYIIWDTPVGLQAKVIKLVISVPAIRLLQNLNT